MVRRSQLDYWREVVCATFFALDVQRGGLARTGFRGEITAQSLDRLRIATVSSEPHAVIRSAEKIRSSYDDDFVVNLAVRGRVMMSQQRFDAVLKPGDFAVYDSALPCRIACPDPFRQIVLKIPRDMFTSHCLLPRGRTAAVVRGDHVSKADALVTRVAPERVFFQMQEDLGGGGKQKVSERVVELHAGENVGQ